MPQGYNWFQHHPPLPPGTVRGELSFWRSEGERRVVYFSQPITQADNLPYWSDLFAIRQPGAAVMATYNGSELRWSASEDCSKPDYLVADSEVRNTVRLASNIDKDEQTGQWYRWIEIRATNHLGLEAGQLASFIARNISDPSVRFRVMIMHDGVTGPDADVQTLFSGTLADF